MKGLMRVFEKIQTLIFNLNAGVLLVIMLIILAQTLGRVVHLSIPWSEEASRYLFVVMILLGINIGISKNLMVRIDMVDNILSPGVKKVFDAARELIALIVAGILVQSCWPLIRIGRFQKSPALQLPMNIIYSIVAFGFVLAVCSVLFRLYQLFTEKEDVKA
ncbi:MAG: TRAP transporter small permease [Stomatobaculum sp.]